MNRCVTGLDIILGPGGQPYHYDRDKGGYFPLVIMTTGEAPTTNWPEYLEMLDESEDEGEDGSYYWGYSDE